MVVLCLGPVCIPLHLLLPFLVTLAHQRGWLLFIKREWVTFRYWKERIMGKPRTTAPSSAPPEAPHEPCCGGAKAEVGARAPRGAGVGTGRQKET